MLPSNAIRRFDLSMAYSEFSLRANRMGFRGFKILPAVGVGEQSADFLKIKVESVLGPIEDIDRAPKGTYKRADGEWTTDTYATKEGGVEEVVDDRQIKMYGSEIDAERFAIERGINRILQAHEDAVAKAVFNTTTWTGAPLTTNVSVPWSTVSAVPITDIDAAIEKVKDGCGAKPNSLIVADYALRKLKRTTQIQDLLKYSGHDDPKNLGLISGLQELFDLENIIVVDGFKNTADEGKTAAFGRLWDKSMAMVCHLSNIESLEDPRPTIGKTIMWNEENASIPGVDDDGSSAIIIEEYREENRRGGVFRFRFDRQIKILHPAAGHLLTNVAA